MDRKADHATHASGKRSAERASSADHRIGTSRNSGAGGAEEDPQSLDREQARQKTTRAGREPAEG